MTRIKVVVVALLAALAIAASVNVAGSTLNPYVAVIGCSRSSLIDDAYKNVSARDATWNAAQGGYSLKYWATATTHPNGWQDSSTGGQSNPPFDTQLALYGQPTAVWFPICIVAGTYTGSTGTRQKAAWADFNAFYTLLRRRTQAPLYVTDTIAVQSYCMMHDPEMMSYVASQAVKKHMATRSSPDLPAAAYPDQDGCHFDPIASTNVGNAAATFIDGTSNG